MNNLSKEKVINSDDGFQRFSHIKSGYSPNKKKHARGNQIPFFNKELSKALMKRTKLRCISLQNKIEENRIRYTKTKKIKIHLIENIIHTIIYNNIYI